MASSMDPSQQRMAKATADSGTTAVESATEAEHLRHTTVTSKTYLHTSDSKTRWIPMVMVARASAAETISSTNGLPFHWYTQAKLEAKVVKPAQGNTGSTTTWTSTWRQRGHQLRTCEGGSHYDSTKDATNGISSAKSS